MTGTKGLTTFLLNVSESQVWSTCAFLVSNRCNLLRTTHMLPQEIHHHHSCEPQMKPSHLTCFQWYPAYHFSKQLSKRWICWICMPNAFIDQKRCRFECACQCHEDTVVCGKASHRSHLGQFHPSVSPVSPVPSTEPSCAKTELSQRNMYNVAAMEHITGTHMIWQSIVFGHRNGMTHRVTRKFHGPVSQGVCVCVKHLKPALPRGGLGQNAIRQIGSIANANNAIGFLESWTRCSSFEGDESKIFLHLQSPSNNSRTQRNRTPPFLRSNQGEDLKHPKTLSLKSSPIRDCSSLLPH